MFCVLLRANASVWCLVLPICCYAHFNSFTFIFIFMPAVCCLQAGCYETTDVGFFGKFDKDTEPGVLHQHGFQHRGVIEPGFVKADLVDRVMSVSSRLVLPPSRSGVRAVGGTAVSPFLGFPISQPSPRSLGAARGALALRP